MSEAICCLIDHRQQYDILRDAIADTGKPRNVFWFEAHCDDWPEMLARHLLLDPWPDDLSCLKRFVSGQMPACDAERILDGWCEQLSLSTIARREDRLDALHRWINQAPLTVFFTQVTPNNWRRLPDYLQGAHKAVTQLGTLATGVRVVVLYACISSCRPPLLSALLWRFHYRRRARKLSEAHALPRMRHLKKEDIAEWHMTLPHVLRKKYGHERIKSAIYLHAFEQQDDPVRFSKVRQYLIDNQGFENAHKAK